VGINITNPTNPIRFPGYEFVPSARGVAMQDNYVFVAYGSGLRIFDIVDPSSPVVLSTYSPGGTEDA